MASTSSGGKNVKSPMPITESQSRTLSASFETERIKALQDERVAVQKRTFTKWINSYLGQAHLHVRDLFMDLCDGSKLIKLVELLAGVKIGMPNRGILRVHKVENVSRVLRYLASHVTLENIGAEDIVDGNPRLILGLVWTIILRFHIQRYLFEDGASGLQTCDARETMDVAQTVSGVGSSATFLPGNTASVRQATRGEQNSEQASVRQALLAWSSNTLKDYRDVDVRDFGASWRNGMAFCALVHKARPELIDLSTLDKSNHRNNLERAFHLAEVELRIPRLLDPEDIDVDRPDERSVMTYVSSYYHHFAIKKKEVSEGKRLAKIVGDVMSAEAMKNKYEMDVSRLLNWIAMTTRSLRERDFANSLDAVQQLLAAFKAYRTGEKQAKLRERGELEALLFSLFAKQKAVDLRPYVPPEGKLLRDVETAWTRLEQEEHERELALRTELLRHEKLERLAAKFRSKAAKRTGWLDEINRVLDEAAGIRLPFIEHSPIGGSAKKTGSFRPESATIEGLNSFERSLQKQETQLNDITAKEARFQQLATLVRDLYANAYPRRDEVRNEEQVLTSRYRATLGRVAERRAALAELRAACEWLRELSVLNEELTQLAASACLVDKATAQQRAADAVDESLAKLSLLASQLDAFGTRAQQLTTRVGTSSSSSADPSDTIRQHVVSQLGTLDARLAATRVACEDRVTRLRTAKRYYDWIAAANEEDAWLTEKTSVMRSDNIGRDLSAIDALLKRHNEEVAEIEAHKANQSRRLLANAGQLESSASSKSTEKRHSKQAAKRVDANDESALAETVVQRRSDLESRWRLLDEQLTRRKTLLEDAAESHRYYAEANDAESWLREKMALCAASGFGSDESSAQALISRHTALEREIDTFDDELKRLAVMAQRMTNVTPPKSDETRPDDDMVEVESEVEEEREVEQDVTEERLVLQVQMLHAYKGAQYETRKGETLQLLERTNNDWWAVRNANRRDGYVPASYVREIEPRRVVRTVRKRVPQTVKVTVKRLVPRSDAEKRKHVVSLHREPSARAAGTLHFDRANVERRQSQLLGLFGEVRTAAQRRAVELRDAALYFRFCALCELFEAWAAEMERSAAVRRTAAGTGNGSSVESSKLDDSRKRYDKFIDDVAANAVRLREIGSVYDELRQRAAARAAEMKTKRSYRFYQSADRDAADRPFLNDAAIRERYERLQKRHARLSSLRSEWEKQLQGASSAECFDKFANETQDWLADKRALADRLLAEVAALPKSAVHDTLNRFAARLHELERQTVSADGKVTKLQLLADTAKDRGERAKPTLQRLEAGWSALLDCVNAIRAALSDAQRAAAIKSDSDGLEKRLAVVRDRLSALQTPRDLRQAERALVDLAETQREVRDDAASLNQLESRVKLLESADPDAFARLGSQLRSMRSEQTALSSLAERTHELLTTTIDLLRCARECDRIDAKVGSIETAMLPRADLDELLCVSSAVDLEKLAKQLDTCHAHLSTFDAKVLRLAEVSERLAADLRLPDKRQREELLAKRAATAERLAGVKRKNRSCKQQVAAAIACRTLRDDAEQLLESVSAKFVQLEVAASDAPVSTRARKLEAATAEMRVARGKLEQLDVEARVRARVGGRVGDALRKTITSVKARFAELEASADRIDEVLQTQKRNLDAQQTLGKLQSGVDRLMRHCSVDRSVGEITDGRQLRRALAEHSLLERDSRALERQLADGADLFSKTDAPTQKRSRALHERITQSLAPLLRDRRTLLEVAIAVDDWRIAAQQQLAAIDQLNAFYATPYVSEFVAARLETERERERRLESETTNSHTGAVGFQPVRSFTEAQQAAARQRGTQQTLSALASKAETLSAAAQRLIDAASGAARDRVTKLRSELDAARSTALQRGAARLAEAGFLTDLYKLVAVDLHETSEAIAECCVQLGVQTTPRDRDDVERLRTKFRALHTRIETIGHSLNAEVTGRVEHLVGRSTHTDDAEALTSKLADLKQRYASLAAQSSTIRRNLDETRFFLAYREAASEFESWLITQLQILSVEEYGENLDEYDRLRNRFVLLANRIEAQAKQFYELARLAASAKSDAALFADEIDDKQERLDADWRAALDTIAQRRDAFDAMRVVLTFTRDAQQLIATLDEKNERMLPGAAAMQLGGRDSVTLERAMKRHEAVELELDAIENDRLTALLAEADRLSAAGHSARVQPVVSALRASWQSARSQAEQTAGALAQAHAFSRFINIARDNASWCDGHVRELRDALDSDRELLHAAQSRDVEALQYDQSQLTLLRTAVSAHDDELRDMVESGEQMVNEGHYAAEEIQERCDRLIDAKNQLLRLCDSRERQLTEMLGFSKFMRDANVMLRQNAALALSFRSNELGDSIEQAERLTRTHRETAATKLQSSVVSAKLEELVAAGLAVQRLSIARENDAVVRRTAELIDSLRNGRSELERLNEMRQKRLDEQCRFLRFEAAASDLTAWLDERLATLQARETDLRSLPFAEKVRLLRVHHVFEAEVVKNRPRVETMKRDAEKLLVEKHSRAADIQLAVNSIIEKWNRLLHSSDARAQALEEAENLVRFEEQHAIVDNWVREQEILVAAAQLGTDLEHCETLQRRVAETVGGRAVDERRMTELHTLAQSLISTAADPREAQSIADRLVALSARWKTLQTALAAYKTRLGAARDLHAFRRDIDDLDDRISASLRALEAAEAPADLAAAERLLALHAAVERACAGYRNQLDSFDAIASRFGLLRANIAPPVEDQLTVACRSHLQSCGEKLKHLTEQAEQRKTALKQQYARFRFIRDASAFLAWTETFERTILEPDVAKIESLQTVTELLGKHKEARGELDGRANSRSFEELLAEGLHFAASDQQCASLCEALRQRRSVLNESWSKRNTDLKQCCELQRFLVECERERRWFETQERTLDEVAESLGSSLTDVDTLARAHENFIKSNEAHARKLEQLAEWSQRVCTSSEQHYANERFASVARELCDERLAALRRRCGDRAERLREARVAQLFYRDVRELMVWIDSKLQHVADSNYSDLANISAKRAKHEALAAEVRAREPKLSELCHRGDELVGRAHAASSEIGRQRNELDRVWHSLLDACAFKSRQFAFAECAVEFLRDSFDVEQTLDAIADRVTQLDTAASRDELPAGEQPEAADAALESLTEDFGRCAEKRARLADRLENDFRKAQGIDETLTQRIAEKVDTIAKRVDEQLPKILEQCRKTLEARKRYLALVADLQQLIDWIAAQRTDATAKLDYGTTVQAAQKAQRRLEAVQLAVDSRNTSRIDPVLSLAAEYCLEPEIDGASEQRKADIGARSVRLRTARDDLLKQLADWRSMLVVALSFVSLLEEIIEANCWLDDHLFSEQSPHNATETIEQLKLLEELVADTASLNANVASLRERADLAFVAIRERLGQQPDRMLNNSLESLLDRHRRFSKAVADRRELLDAAKRFFDFERRSNQLLAAIAAQSRVAASVNYGHDLEHCRALEAELSEFVQLVVNTATNDRVLRQLNEANTLLAGVEMRNHFDAIRTCVNRINTAWQSLRALCASRRDALANAKQIHAFTKLADELLEQLEEKEVELDAQERNTAQSLALSANSSYASSTIELETLQALAKQHAAVEHDLTAIQQRVDAFRQDFERLRRRFAEAEPHLAERFDEVETMSAKLMQRCRIRRQRLASLEQLRFYLLVYNELMQFCDAMLVRVAPASSAPIFGILNTTDVEGAQQLLASIKDARIEVDAKRPEVERCVADGLALQRTNQLLADELGDRVRLLGHKFFTQLTGTVVQRERLYDKLVDLVGWKRDIGNFEAWLGVNEQRARILPSEPWLDAANNVDMAPLVSEFQVLVKSVASQEDARLDLVKRRTLIEIETEDLLRKEREEREKARREEERARRQTVKRLSSIVTGSTKSPTSGSGANASKSPQKSQAATPTGGDRAARREKRLKLIPSFSVRTTTAKRGNTGTAKSIAPSTNEEGVYAEPEDPVDRSGRPLSTPASPTIVMEGELERKMECVSGGRKALLRNWKTFYTVLYSEEHRYLHFYRDIADAQSHSQLLRAPQTNAPVSPLLLYGAVARIPNDYSKRKFVFRLHLRDVSDYLFSCRSEIERDNWISAINRIAQAITGISMPVGSNKKAASLLPIRETAAEHLATSPDYPSPYGISATLHSTFGESVYESVGPHFATLDSSGRSGVLNQSPIPASDIAEFYAGRTSGRMKDKRADESSLARSNSVRKKPLASNSGSYDFALSYGSQMSVFDTVLRSTTDTSRAHSSASSSFDLRSEAQYVNVPSGTMKEHESATSFQNASSPATPTRSVPPALLGKLMGEPQVALGNSSSVESVHKAASSPVSPSSEAHVQGQRSTLKMLLKSSDGKSPRRAETPEATQQAATQDVKAHKTHKLFPWSKK